MSSGRTNNYPESGRGLGHVTPTIFGIRSNISLKLRELEISNMTHGFVWAMPSRRINNFPESRRGLGHVTLHFLAVRSAILATAWLLVVCPTCQSYSSQDPSALPSTDADVHMISYHLTCTLCT